MRRFRAATLAIAVLLMLGAVPAWAGTTSGSGMVTGKIDSPQTLFVGDQVSVRITPDTQIVDLAGNPVSFDEIPAPGVAGPHAGQAVVQYTGSQTPNGVVADRVVVKIVTQ